MPKEKLSPEHTLEVRQKILDSAKRLLVRYGYQKTTIRMIVDDSGVLTGSIYYFFKNKEDIFQSLFMSVVKNCISYIDEYCSAETPVFKYAAICELELKKMEDDENIRDVYYAAYSSKTIFENLVEEFVYLAEHLFTGTDYEMSEHECYQKTLLIKGAMRACIAEMYFKRLTSPLESRRQLLNLVFLLFDIPEEEQEYILQKIDTSQELLAEIAQKLVEEPV